MFSRFRIHTAVFRYQLLQLRMMSSIPHPRYHYPRLDDIEDLEKYRPGGFKPVSIGDVFAGDRYGVMHKLGFGGSSTVWLVRDQQCPREQPQSWMELLALKVMSAEQSSRPPKEIPDLHIPQKFNTFSHAVAHPGRENLPVIRDYFLQESPNGSHLCLITDVAGPSIFSLAECPGRVSGSRRLRGDLARKVARQVATSVELLHSAGIIHGDLTSSNILFRVSDEVHKWSVEDMYRILGSPDMEEVVTRDGALPGPFAPSQVIAPINISRLSSLQLLKEDVVLIDFGQSFCAKRPPLHYTPATPLHYLSPEAFFNSKISFASDVWAMACTIFEIRAGSPLFDPFLYSDTLILKQIVETLGRLPDPWWNSWEARQAWFHETGMPKSEEEQRREGVLLTAVKSSLRQKLCKIGEQDDTSDVDEGKMIERTGNRLDGEEVELLVDLLEKMLRYHPKDRISMTEAVQHPWFRYS